MLKFPFIRLADYIARPYNNVVRDKRMTRETKSVQRLFVDQPLAADKTLTLTGNPAHYLRNVYASADDAVLVFNGRDGEWQAHITNIDKRTVTLVTAHRRDRKHPRNPPSRYLAAGGSCQTRTP